MDYRRVTAMAVCSLSDLWFRALFCAKDWKIIHSIMDDLFSWKYFPSAGGLAVRSGIFAFHQFRFLSIEGRFARMGAYHLLQLGHKISQGLVASVQPVSKLGADRHGFLIRGPSLC